MFEADSEVETWIDPMNGETFNSYYVPVWRFRRAMFHDFQARMDWCVKEYDQANHNPVAAFNGDRTDSIVYLESSPGETVELDASVSTDPGKDGLGFQWWMYREAGTYAKQVAIPDAGAKLTALTIPEDAGGSEIQPAEGRLETDLLLQWPTIRGVRSRLRSRRNTRTICWEFASRCEFGKTTGQRRPEPFRIV